MTEQNEQQTVDALGLADLALMANIIQVTSERGAIKANEMQAVGALYSKLVAFVNANAPSPAEVGKDDADTAMPKEK